MIGAKEVARSELLAYPHPVAHVRAGTLWPRRPRRCSPRCAPSLRATPTPASSPSSSSARSKERTPEIFLFDKGGTLRKCGMVEDNCDDPVVVRSHSFRKYSRPTATLPHRAQAGSRVCAWHRNMLVRSGMNQGRSIDEEVRSCERSKGPAP